VLWKGPLRPRQWGATPLPTRLVYALWNVDNLDDGLGTREGHRQLGTPVGCVLAPGGLPKAPTHYLGGQNDLGGQNVPQSK
jgi:hypothetical protein